MNLLNIILSPIISEKSLNDVSRARFAFKVSRNAGKNEIKRAVEQIYEVNVVSVATVNLKDKARQIRSRTRISKVKSKPFKKAVVTLKEGQKISVFESGN